MINDIIFYSEQGIQNLAHDQIWKGKGTEEDPFVIINANIIGQAILIRNSSLYITFLNCNFDLAQFEGCCNIVLKDCTFEKLILSNSKNIEIVASYISDLKLSRIKTVSFKKSVVLEISTKYKKIKNITLEDCQVNNEFLNYILDNMNRGLYIKLKEIIPSIMIIFGLFIFYRLFWITYDLQYSDIINLMIVAGVIISLLISLIISLFFHHIAKRKDPKILISTDKNI